jgi:hypothetical protein
MAGAHPRLDPDLVAAAAEVQVLAVAHLESFVESRQPHCRFHRLE